MFNSVRIGDVDLYDEYGCILKHVEIGAPTVQTKYLSIPLKDGDLDLTELLTDKVKYNDREIKIDLKYIGEHLVAVTSDMENYLHGQRMTINFDEDIGYFYVGRVHLASPAYEVANYGGVIHLVAKCDPYKYTYNSTADDWEWDPFDFEEGVIQDLSNLVVDGTLEVELIADMATIYPKVTSNAQMTVQFGTTIVTIPVGTTTLYDFELHEGSNTLVFTGNGTITVDYRGGRL